MQCTYIKNDQQRCKARAMKDSVYCFTHNPETRQEHALAVVKGGKNSSRRDLLDMDSISLQKPAEVVVLLEETINGVRTGEITPNIANTIGYLSSHLLKAIQIADLDQRLSILEKVLIQNRKGKDE